MSIIRVISARFKYLTLSLVFLILAILLVNGCSTEVKQTSISYNQYKADALTMIETVFVGDYTRAEIKSRLDMAMRLFDLPITEDNYNRAGSVLVTLRKEASVAEMDILDHMIRSSVPGLEISFPDQATLSAISLQLGID